MEAGATLEELERAVCEGLVDESLELAGRALEQGIPPLTVLNDGVVAGLQQAGQLWREGQYFVPEVIMSAEAFRRCLSLLKPRLATDETPKVGRCVIGTVAGDMHDLGKNIVVAMLSGAGFEVVDLGVNVPTQTFLKHVKEFRPDILGIGAYMSTTMLLIRDVIAALERAGLRQSVKVMIGGVPVTQLFAEQVRADGYAADAMSAVRVATELLEKDSRDLDSR